MKWLIPFVALALAAQEPPKPAQEAPKLSPAEQDLRTRVAEAGNSPVEFLRALEQHLELYPKSAQRADIERAGQRDERHVH